MKIYFPEIGEPFIGDFAFPEEEPACKAIFDLGDEASGFVNRYDLQEGELVDLYPELDDEEVAQLLNEKEAAEAERIAAELAAAQKG